MAITVAFQGVPGAYSELAAAQHFGRGIKTLPCEEFAGVFRAVVTGKARWGIIPIENSLTGSIHQNFDLLLQHDVWIAGEEKLRVSHALIGKKGAKISALRKVYSHPQALWQCSQSLKKFPLIEPTAYFDTAGSAKFVSEDGTSDMAALASKEAAARYGLKVLKTGMEDNKKNFTRFLILANKKTTPKGAKVKTSIAFDIKNVPGALHSSLGVFATRGLQLWKIESRPIPGRPWEYLFYLDFGKSLFTKEAKAALKDLERFATDIKVFGSYPSAS